MDNVNLDVATSVTGDGDIGHLTVNAPGSTVTMLPDQITIRPGVEATIDGEKMDSEAAAESSADPRLLAGYPEVTDLAPTSATARFSANKKGTVYWAVTSVTDGSVGVDDLLNPSSYSPKIVKSGTLSLTGSSQPGSVKISGLTSDGSYYLSAEGHLLYYAGQHRAQFRLRLPLYVQNHQHLRAGDDHGHQVLPAVLGGAAQGGVRPHGQRL